MKWRIVLTVLFVITLFAGFAYLYVNAFVRQRQHAVILFVVNGLDLNTLNQARQQLGRPPVRGEPDDPAISDTRRRIAYRSSMLNLDTFWNIALLGVQQPGQPVPDEGANATALACGQRVENSFVAFNNRNEALQSLIYVAEQSRRATGLVTTSSLVQPTPVAFYSTTKGTPEPYRNANDLVYSGIDVVLGGGERYFTPANASNEGGRRDGRNLFNELKEVKNKKYTILHSRDDLNNVSTWSAGTLFGVFAPDQFYFSSLQPDHPRQPSLAEMTRVAVSRLNNIGNYFLVVEDGLVARASEQNLGKLASNEVAQVDEAIQSAIEYAGPDALVLVTNNYNLGAVGQLPSLSAGDFSTLPKGTENPIVSKAPEAQPAWLTGPGGPAITRTQTAWVRQQYANGSFSTNAPGLLQPQLAFRFQARAFPTSEPAWLASRGEGSSQFRGFFNNTDLFDLICEQF